MNLIPLAQDERIQAVIDTRTYEDGNFLFFATRKGTVKKTKLSDYDSALRNGLIAINLVDDDELVRVVQTTGENDILMVSEKGQAIRFSEAGRAPDGPGDGRRSGDEAPRGRPRRELRRGHPRGGDALRQQQRARQADQASTCSTPRTGAGRAFGA